MAESKEKEVLNDSVFDEQEYETQFFSFTPKSFVDGVYNEVFDYLQDLMDFVKNLLLKEFSQVMSAEEINLAAFKILEKLIKKANISSDKLEVFLVNNVFKIPENVILTEDLVHSNQESSKEIDDEITKLTNRVNSLSYVNCELRKELRDISQVQMQYDKVYQDLETLKSSYQQMGVSNWTDTLSFINEKSATLLKEISSNNNIDQLKNRPKDDTSNEKQMETD